MPRLKSPVKPIKHKNTENFFNKLNVPSAIDIHFHGAFGIDLMTADRPALDALSLRLAASGIAGFCPTTLSAPPKTLRQTVQRLGQWIRSKSTAGNTGTLARPLGLHLEGPFLHPEMAGAHPRGAIRPFDLDELEMLWEESQHTLKRLTLAPELLTPKQLSLLCRFSKKRQVRLSIGHSKATSEEAERAFRAGFTGVTHAWNALAFHHRSPGVLGAALGRKGVFVEAIIDGEHVSDTVLRWLLKLHPTHQICFVSDCVAGGGASKKPVTSGAGSNRSASPKHHNTACRLPNGQLAGGGLLLPDAYRRFLRTASKEPGTSPAKLLQKTRACLTTAPLKCCSLPSFKKLPKV